MLTTGKRIFAVIIAGIMIGIVAYLFLFFNFGSSKNKKAVLGQKETKEGEVFNPALLTWQKVQGVAPWSPRDSHAAFVYQDKIWLIGGLNGNDYLIGSEIVGYGEAPHFGDIWVSDDGLNWNLLTDKAPWGERRSIEVVIFKDKMWLIPGWGPWTGLKSEVWYSEDGVSWEKATSNLRWQAREGHQLVVFKDKLWLLGGVNYEKRETKNDVWYSEDGVNWFEAVSIAPWQPRWDHKAFEFKDRLWLIGGMDLNDNVFGDIWVSDDGQNWSLASDNPPFAARQGHEAVLFKDRVWIIGRFNSTSQGGGNNDVWFSEDGINWQRTKTNPIWEGREDHAAVVFQDKIWVLGGMTVNWSWQNDIWYSVFSP